jgi:gamma-butyrobetaine dioxygenase
VDRRQQTDERRLYQRRAARPPALRIDRSNMQNQDIGGASAQGPDSVEAALALLAGPLGDASYGEGLSLRAHSLQAAALATAQGRGPAFIAAALLHDIGWAVAEGDHAAHGAAIAQRLCGEAVARPIRLHVAAKRYLTAVEPSYFDALSDASRATLALQGGPMSAAEARAFEATPGFAMAIALRRIDDQAKDADARTLPLSAYRDILNALADRARAPEDAEDDV